eukprot:gene8637-10228_t
MITSLEGGPYKVAKVVDIPGTQDRFSDFLSYVKSFEHAFYLVNLAKLKDAHYIARVRSDITKTIEALKASTSKRLNIIGTHVDESEWKNIQASEVNNVLQEDEIFRALYESTTEVAGYVYVANLTDDALDNGGDSEYLWLSSNRKSTINIDFTDSKAVFVRDTIDAAYAETTPRRIGHSIFYQRRKNGNFIITVKPATLDVAGRISPVLLIFKNLSALQNLGGLAFAAIEHNLDRQLPDSAKHDLKKLVKILAKPAWMIVVVDQSFMTDLKSTSITDFNTFNNTSIDTKVISLPIIDKTELASLFEIVNPSDLQPAGGAEGDFKKDSSEKFNENRQSIMALNTLAQGGEANLTEADRILDMYGLRREALFMDIYNMRRVTTNKLSSHKVSIDFTKDMNRIFDDSLKVKLQVMSKLYEGKAEFQKTQKSIEKNKRATKLTVLVNF